MTKLSRISWLAQVAVQVAMIWLALLAVPELARAVEVDVIPRPLHVAARPGPAVVIASGTPVHFAARDHDVRDVAQYFADVMARSGVVRTVVREGESAPGEVAITIVRGPVRGGPEAYQLDIGAAGVRITAATRAGMLYGAVTTWQLLTADGGKPLKPMHIDDAPRFPWRGLMLDSARHFQSVAFIERMLDWMALHKLNTLQWHLTDDQGWRLEIEHYPRLTSVGGWRVAPDGSRYGGFYTHADVRRLVAYAAARNITIVPEIEMPGHALAAILAYPAVGFTGKPLPSQGDWGVFPSIYGVDEATFGLLETVLGEVVELFPSRFIAIGGDEAVKDEWHNSPAVQTRMKALGIADEAALQSWFVRRIGKFLNSHGRRAIGWDEILLGGDLPVNNAVLSWHGADGALAAARSGHDVVMATAPTLYFDNRQSTLPSEPPGRGVVVSLRDVYDYDPGDPPVTAGGAAPSLLPADAHHVLGLQGNIWTEHIVNEANVEAMALPRAAALAEAGWTAADRRDWPDFVARLPSQFARYAALGLNADTGAVGVASQTRFDAASGRVHVTLSNQAGLGEIRYAVDGALPASASARYVAPLDLGTPVRLRAATFAGGRQVSPTIDRVLDATSLHHRSSQELRLCSDAVALNLDSGVAGAAPLLVDIMNPCWRWPDADLAGISAITVGVAALPFNFQLGGDAKKIVLRPPSTTAGELVVRDGCDGPVVATLPLATAAHGGRVTPLTAPLAKLDGRHELCLTFTGRSLDPLWTLAWVQLGPAAATGS